ncbi:STAS domain-containing protein [Streptomyces sp. CRN 30]|uniref:STAS domain-containing protein n=1 Tax=Streptomyces sp. CRN 30 TaxID=3075613 RepID=UPI002A8038C0|nr:STAS domain-containing protein [Streptomyces sp. CRN 30]
MTTMPPEFDLDITLTPDVLTIEVIGDLDYETSDELLTTVDDHLTPGTALERLRLDFRRLTWIDSLGLSTLLMVHRRTSATGVSLALDNRPDFLERMLDLTGTLDHFTATAEAEGKVTDAGTG